MSNSNDRFYQMEFKDRPVLHGDIGSNIRIQGLVVGGESAQAVLMLPGLDLEEHITVETLSAEEWNDFIRRADDPEILIGPAKTFQRKCRWEISGEVQQKIWAADGCQCYYCGIAMGKRKMTIDHFVPLEKGGANDETNYLTACSACNKRKGNMDPFSWCEQEGVDFIGTLRYLKEERKLP